MRHFTQPAIFLAALAISSFFVVSIIDLARKRQLFDGNNHIKRHSEQVSSLGGIAIFASFWIAFFLLGGEAIETIIYPLFASAFLLFLVGVKDDLVGIHAFHRLGVQIGVASLLFGMGLQITHLPGMASELPLWASYLLTILLMGAVVNAYNFIDGINGLAGGLALTSSLGFAWVFHRAGAFQEVLLSLALAGSVLGFLYFNFGKARIFMGDNGSTFVGMIFAYLAIAMLRPEMQQKLEGHVPAYFAGAILLIPLADMVKVVMGRLLRGGSPFRGDHTHIHHLLTKTGISHRRTCLVLYGWNVGVIIFSLILLPQDFFLSMIALILAACFPYLGILLSERMIKSRKTETLKTSGQ